MTDEAILKLMKNTMTEMLLENNKRLLTSVEQSIVQAVHASEERLTKKIKQSQINTIDTLSELIHTGYNLHEGRIQRIEDELNLPPLKQKH